MQQRQIDVAIGYERYGDVVHCGDHIKGSRLFPRVCRSFAMTPVHHREERSQIICQLFPRSEDLPAVRIVKSVDAEMLAWSKRFCRVHHVRLAFAWLRAAEPSCRDKIFWLK